ncbi:PCI domain containing protein 2 [Echinococcus multilocularis]|uniref:PCI domain containing protein 2 n=1 Tax=Echinococcus multilocularis TaxID=6211 RepID=A0A068YBI1_ECHMU|nr:PCI domain containing protein 2 [Echinococcus multilocularis]
MLPVVVAAAVDLRRFAHALDVLSKKKVGDSDSAYGSHLERVAQAIMKLFQICAADSLTAIEDSKKRGMMGLANQLFKIYFQACCLSKINPLV